MTEPEADNPSSFAIPNTPQNDDTVPPWMLAVLILVISIPVLITLFFTYRKPVPIQPAGTVIGGSPTPVPVSRFFTGDEHNRGWYWGQTQKFPGTPSHWLYTAIGDKHCWHSPRQICK